MIPYLSLTEAADRLHVSPEWFLANVAPLLPSPIELNRETSWLTTAIDDWKTRCDAARDVALDELASIDQEVFQMNAAIGFPFPTAKLTDWEPPQFDGFFYRSSNASALI